jgi:hypothetical protein
MNEIKKVEGPYGEVADLSKLAGLAVNLGGIGIFTFRVGREENFTHPLDLDKETYAVINPQTSEWIGIITPYGASTEMEPFRVYFLYPIISR